MIRHEGGVLIVIGALLGLAVSIYNFFSPVGFLSPLSNIAGSPGAGLVIFSTAVLFVFGLVLAGKVTSRGVILFCGFGSLVAIIGTGFAAYLLESMFLLGLMALCLVGWFMRFLMRQPEHN